MSAPNFRQPGPWRELLPHALKLMAHLERSVKAPPWTFGGGTVLMLRIGHRHSRDIDLFVPDPHYLGYLNPRLSDVAQDISTDYEENAEFIKFYLPQGEIDIVVGAALTEQPFDKVRHARRSLRVETCAEIIAKKMWHRGQHGKARDLFDLCAVADAEPAAIARAAPFMRRHGQAFLDRLRERGKLAQAEFEAIDALKFQRPFSECLEQARHLIAPLLARKR